MYGNNLVCHLCCSEAVVKGCICDGSTKLIGSNCLSDHISDTDVDHNLVDIDLASRMKADPSLMQLYLDELPSIHDAIKYIRVSSLEIKKSKDKFDQARTVIITRIEDIFSTFYKRLEEASEKSNSFMKCLSKYKLSLHEEGRLVMDKFRSQGSSALLANFPLKVDIPIDQILDYLNNTLTMNSYHHQSNIQADSFKRISMAEEFKKQFEEMKKISDDQKEIPHKYYQHISTKDQIIQELKQHLSIELQRKDSKLDDISNTISELNHYIATLTHQFQEQTKELKAQIPPESYTNTVIHPTVRCDGCRIRPIVGIRYKCSVCRNFDFCDKCFVNQQHPHPFTKIK